MFGLEVKAAGGRMEFKHLPGCVSVAIIRCGVRIYFGAEWDEDILLGENYSPNERI